MGLYPITKPSTTDQLVSGKITCYDRRVGVTVAETDWNKYVIMNSDGELMIPLEIAEQIMIENEELRELLYVEDSDTFVQSMLFLQQHMGHSTSSILRIIKQIEHNTNNNITGREVFKFTYTLLSQWYRVDFKLVPANCSKLQWLWQEGWLPQVSLIVNMFNMFINQMQIRYAKEMSSLYKAIKQKKGKGRKRRP